MPVADSHTGRALTERRIVQIDDAEVLGAEASNLWARNTVAQVGNFSAAWAPMLWQDTQCRLADGRVPAAPPVPPARRSAAAWLC